MAWLELDPDPSHSPVLIDHGVGAAEIFKRDGEIAAEMRALGVVSTAETFGDRPLPQAQQPMAQIEKVSAGITAVISRAA